MSMAFFHLFWGFPAARSRVVIRLAKGTKAKPNANTRTLRPDKCLVVPSLSPRLRPNCPRNIGANAATTRIRMVARLKGRQKVPKIACKSLELSHHCEMNISELKPAVQRAIKTLYARDAKLFELAASEWAIAHRLAVYLEHEIPGWDVDCEYNKQGEGTNLAIKTNAETVGATQRTRPDIILHHRGKLTLEHNLLVIELKMRATPADWRKVTEFTAAPHDDRKFQYQYGLALSFEPTLKPLWYSNGTYETA